MTTAGSFQFTCPFKINSGNKALEHLPADLAAMDAKKPLILSNAHFEKKGKIKKVSNAFYGSGLTLGVYSGIAKDSGLSLIKELVTLYTRKGYDSIIAVGGGHIADIAKVLNIAVSETSLDVSSVVGASRIEKPLNPFVYIPVDTGDGKEATREVRVDKMSFVSDYLAPDSVVIDSGLIEYDNDEACINASMTALGHSIEAYGCMAENPIAEAYSHTVVRFVMDNLLEVITRSKKEHTSLLGNLNKSKDRNTYTSLVNASVMGGCIYSNLRENTTYDLATVMSEKYNILPGLLMGVILPYVLEYKERILKRDLEHLLLPIAGLDTYCATPENQRFSAAIGRIRELSNTLYASTSYSVPRTLLDIGLFEKDLDHLAKATSDRWNNSDTEAYRLVLGHALVGQPLNRRMTDRG